MVSPVAHSFFGQKFVSSGIVVSEFSHKGRLRAIKALLFFLAVSFVYNIVLRSDVAALQDAVTILTDTNTKLTRDNEELMHKLEISSSLRVELAQTKQSLVAEIVRKKELAVMYERAEAARKQAVADHKVLADKLRAYEAKKKK